MDSCKSGAHGAHAMSFSPPTPAQEQELHGKLLAGDHGASQALAEMYAQPLVAYLRRINSARLATDILYDAVHETWASLCKRPASYDGKGSLWSFLRRSAQADLLNLLAKERRQRKLVNLLDDVEQGSANGMLKIAAPDANAERQDELDRVRHSILPLVHAGLTEGELRCLKLYLDGVQETTPYAEALGGAGLPAAQQRKMVKRTKDKLIKRIQRAREKLDEDADGRPG